MWRTIEWSVIKRSAADREASRWNSETRVTEDAENE